MDELNKLKDAWAIDDTYNTYDTSSIDSIAPSFNTPKPLYGGSEELGEIAPKNEGLHSFDIENSLEKIRSLQSGELSPSQAWATGLMGLVPGLLGYAIDGNQGAAEGFNIGSKVVGGYTDNIQKNNLQQAQTERELVRDQINENQWKSRTDYQDKQQRERAKEYIEAQKGLKSWEQSQGVRKDYNKPQGENPYTEVQKGFLDLKKQEVERRDREEFSKQRIPGTATNRSIQLSAPTIANLEKMKSGYDVSTTLLDELKLNLQQNPDAFDVFGKTAQGKETLANLLIESGRMENGAGANLTEIEVEAIKGPLPKLASGMGFMSAIKGTIFERDPLMVVEVLKDIKQKSLASKFMAYGRPILGFKYDKSKVLDPSNRALLDDNGYAIPELVPENVSLSPYESNFQGEINQEPNSIINEKLTAETAARELDGVNVIDETVDSYVTIRDSVTGEKKKVRKSELSQYGIK